MCIVWETSDMLTNSVPVESYLSMCLMYLPLGDKIYRMKSSTKHKLMKQYHYLSWVLLVLNCNSWLNHNCMDQNEWKTIMETMCRLALPIGSTSFKPPNHVARCLHSGKWMKYEWRSNNHLNRKKIYVR